MEAKRIKARIRRAVSEEIDWVNDRYREVNFKLSHFERETIAIAEWEGERAGLGRLIKVSPQAEELGGMYVLPDFRRKKIADQIVQFLIEARNPYATLYCLPFEAMAHFYATFGFEPVTDPQTVPREIREKHQWCNDTYPHATFLYVLKNFNPKI